MNDLLVQDVKIFTVNVPLTDEFVISRGTVKTAQNIFVKIKLNNGICGYGEIAPFPELMGRNMSESLKKAEWIAFWIKGKDISRYRRLINLMNESVTGHPAVQCGYETAILDAFTRSHGMPLYQFFGGNHSGPLETDITIPILSFERSIALARKWHGSGFKKIKMKVGVNADQELKIILEIHKNHPDISFIIDANQGFSPMQAISFANKLEYNSVPLILFEQPVHKDDLEGMAEVRNSIHVPLAADESVSTIPDLQNVIRKKAADIINLKIMKSGVLVSMDLAIAARTMGLKLMIGGMVESRLAMGCSLAISAGLGIIDHFDLDTPLLMAEDPVKGGYYYEGPHMFLSDEPGMGCVPAFGEDL